MLTTSKTHRRHEKGFSLTELVVTLGIMMLITTQVLFSQSKYTEAAALRGLADDIAITLSQAQIYGVGVREVSAGSNDFSSAYGMEFRLASAGGSNDSYIFFVDRGGTNRNKIYDSGWTCPTSSGTECLVKTQITRGNVINEICYIPLSGSESCSNIGRVDVSFYRPETKADIIFFDRSGNLLNLSNLKGVRITLISPGGLRRSVSVFVTGQVSVQ